MLKVEILSGDRSNGQCRDSAYTSPGTYKKPSSVNIDNVNVFNIPLVSFLELSISPNKVFLSFIHRILDLI